jgi:small subunit ribosomal protein S4e
MITGGRNMGRVGVITHRERHEGGFGIVHLKDAIDNAFATRETNVFVIGSEKPWISLPRGKGVKVSFPSFLFIRTFLETIILIYPFSQLSIAEERDRRRAMALAGH